MATKTKKLHQRIQELKLRSTPINYADGYVDQNGDLQNVDFKASEDNSSNTIKGYLCVWGVRDTYGTVFVKGCFAKSIAERGPDSGAKQKIGFLWQHDSCDPIGQYTILKEDDYGLYFEAKVDDVENGQRALTQVASGTLNQFSVGFDYIWDALEYDQTMDAVLIKECILMEGSIVTFGSNDETYALRSIEDIEAKRDVLEADTEDFLRSIPRRQQLELRQLLTRHITLARINVPQQRTDEAVKFSYNETAQQLIFKPDELPEVKVGEYKLNLSEFKN